MTVPTQPAGALLDAAARAPYLGLEDLAGQSVMIVAPHPDDETFGCGMALASAAAAGTAICLVLLTRGEASHPGSLEYPTRRLARLRLGELRAALDMLAPGQTVPVLSLDLPDGCCGPGDITQAVRRRTIGFAQDHEIDTVWTTWGGDPHCDHTVAALLGADIADALDARLRTFPVWGRFGNAVPAELGRFHDSRFQQRKADAAACYRSQLGLVVTDAPAGFVMPPAIYDHFVTAPEIFIRER